MNQSKISKADSDAFRSTGQSIIFKTVGRQKEPNWTNRLRKDINDLTYDLEIDHFGKNQSRKSSKSFRKISTKRPSVDKDLSINLHESKKSIQMKNKRKNFFEQELGRLNKKRMFQSLDLGEQSSSKNKSVLFNNNGALQGRKNNQQNAEDSPVDYGLSLFEFKNTIKGKIDNQKGCHLKFQNQTPRKFDLLPHLENLENEAQNENAMKRRYRKNLQRLHPFESYTQRRVFEVKNKLDKIYNIQGAKEKSSPRRIKRTVPFDSVPGRKSEAIKQCSYLSYEIEEGEKAVRKKQMEYAFQNARRELKIGKEVIYPKRGCSR